jgi:hypothetical protein
LVYYLFGYVEVVPQHLSLPVGKWEGQAAARFIVSKVKIETRQLCIEQQW